MTMIVSSMNFAFRASMYFSWLLFSFFSCCHTSEFSSRKIFPGWNFSIIQRGREDILTYVWEQKEKMVQIFWSNGIRISIRGLGKWKLSTEVLISAWENQTKKHSIHAGDAKTNMDLTVTGLKLPVFFCKMGNTCVFSSLASGLMYLND